MSKKKVTLGKKVLKEDDPAMDEDIVDEGPDLSTHVSRVLLSLKSKSPITKADLSAILHDSNVAEDFDYSALWEFLKKSIYVRWDEVGEQLYFEHELQNVKGTNLKDFIDKKKAGVSREELIEFNLQLAVPIHDLLRAAGVLPILGWRDSNKTCLMMYPRGNSDFRVPLSGTVNVKSDSRFLETSHDLRREIRRGDAIIIDGKTYRVSTEPSKLDKLSIKELKELIQDELGGEFGGIEERDVLEAKAHSLLNEKGMTSKRFAKKLISDSTEILEKNSQHSLEKVNQFSSSSNEDPPESSKGAVIFKYEFDARRLPLDRLYKGAPLSNITVYKHGSTNDVREAYWKVAENPANNFKLKESERLDSKLMERRLMSEDLLSGMNRNKKERSEVQARRLADAASGKAAKKQRRSNFVRKITNTHMQ